MEWIPPTLTILRKWREIIPPNLTPIRKWNEVIPPNLTPIRIWNEVIPPTCTPIKEWSNTSLLFQSWHSVVTSRTRPLSTTSSIFSTGRSLNMQSTWSKCQFIQVSIHSLIHSFLCMYVLLLIYYYFSKIIIIII